jgi:hypothetical protein
MASSGSGTEVLERIKVREVAGVLRSRDPLDAAVGDLLAWLARGSSSELARR